MKLLAAAVLVGVLMSGCATLEILDILTDTPTPVCDSDSAGVKVGSKQCVKYSDGVYRWAK